MQQQPPSNDKFGTYLSMVTHDLLAPLRKLGVLTDKLLEKCGKNADLDEYGRRIHRSVEELRSVILSCRMIAEATPDNMEIQPVDVAALLKEVVNEKIKDRGEVRMEAENLPPVMGDKKQLRQLFMALVENADTFRKKEVPLVLEINTEITGQSPAEELKITIRDNGIGFDSQDAELIFDPTIRLNGKSAYPGNGLGLTLAKKIVSNHSGQIYAESTRDEGSCFTVVLPINRSNA